MKIEQERETDEEKMFLMQLATGRWYYKDDIIVRTEWVMTEGGKAWSIVTLDTIKVKNEPVLLQ